MTDLACTAPKCAIPGRHRDGCKADDCRGCLPGLAQDGLRLCPLHTTRIQTDALRIAELDHDIEQVLTATGRGGERTGGTSDHGTVLNQRAVEIRTEARHTLASWCRLIADERGIHLPPDNLDTMATYLATHNVWLSAHPTAGDCSDELSSLQRRAWNVAYPTGARVFEVGPCPTCTAPLRVVLRAVDSLLPSELVCEGTHDTNCECGKCPPHRWPADTWRELGRRIHQRYLSPSEVADEYRIPIGTVYRHASEQRWRRTDDGRRPALYLADDVRATLDTRAAPKEDHLKVVAL